MSSCNDTPEEEGLDPPGQQHPCYEPDIGANLLQEILTWKKLELMQSCSVQSWLSNVQAQIARKEAVDLITSLEDAIRREHENTTTSKPAAAVVVQNYISAESQPPENTTPSKPAAAVQKYLSAESQPPAEDTVPDQCMIVQETPEKISPTTTTEPLKEVKVSEPNSNIVQNQVRVLPEPQDLKPKPKSSKKTKKKSSLKSNKRQQQSMVEKEMSLKALLFGGAPPNTVSVKSPSASTVTNPVQNTRTRVADSFITPIQNSSEQTNQSVQYNSAQNLDPTQLFVTPEDNVTLEKAVSDLNVVNDPKVQQQNSTSISALDLATILSSESLKIDPSWQPMLDMIESAPTSPVSIEDGIMSSSQSLLLDKLILSNTELDTTPTDPRLLMSGAGDMSLGTSVPQSRTSYRAQSAPTVQGNQRQHLMSPVEIMDSSTALKSLISSSNNNNTCSQFLQYPNQPPPLRFSNASETTVKQDTRLGENNSNFISQAASQVQFENSFNRNNISSGVVNSGTLSPIDRFDNFVVPPPPTSTFGVYTSRTSPANTQITTHQNNPLTTHQSPQVSTHPNSHLSIHQNLQLSNHPVSQSKVRKLNFNSPNQLLQQQQQPQQQQQHQPQHQPQPQPQHQPPQQLASSSQWLNANPDPGRQDAQIHTASTRTSHILAQLLRSPMDAGLSKKYKKMTTTTSTTSAGGFSEHHQLTPSSQMLSSRSSPSGAPATAPAMATHIGLPQMPPSLVMQRGQTMQESAPRVRPKQPMNMNQLWKQSG